VSFSVNAATPNITGFTPRYLVTDTFSYFVSYALTCAGCENGDILHDATGLFTPDVTLSLAPGATSFGLTLQWQPGTYQPWFLTYEMQHPGGPYGTPWSTAFFGIGSQSTLAVSPTTGTLFQVEQKTGNVYTLATDGTTSSLFPGTQATTVIQIAVDDTTGNIAYLFTGGETGTGNDVAVFNEAGTRVCDVTPGMGYVSSIAAKGGYMVFTDPVDNLVGIAKMDCSGFTTISVAGQPWAVAIANGEAYVLSRDKWSANGLPGLTKIGVPSGTIEASVELTGLPPVSTVRAANPYMGLYQVVAFNQTPIAAVLSTSDSTDGSVLTISTNTSGGNAMKITNTVAVPEVPLILAAQDSNSSLWVGYILADSAEAVTHIKEIDPTTGSLTPDDVGVCTTGVLAGGFLADANGVYCAQGSVIQPPQNLQP
jgi:hypothetical protein